MKCVKKVYVSETVGPRRKEGQLHDGRIRWRSTCMNELLIEWEGLN